MRRCAQGDTPRHEGAHAQETLDSYGVQHDQFDFESELGWEGSNDKFLTIMKNSPYFVPQTQSNDQGVPQVSCVTPFRPRANALDPTQASCLRGCYRMDPNSPRPPVSRDLRARTSTSLSSSRIKSCPPVSAATPKSTRRCTCCALTAPRCTPSAMWSTRSRRRRSATSCSTSSAGARPSHPHPTSPLCLALVQFSWHC